MNGTIDRAITTTAPRRNPATDQFAYAGSWGLSDEDATAGDGAENRPQFNARRVFLVLGSPDEARSVQVLLDGRPIPASWPAQTSGAAAPPSTSRGSTAW